MQPMADRLMEGTFDRKTFVSLTTEEKRQYGLVKGGRVATSLRPV